MFCGAGGNQRIQNKPTWTRKKTCTGCPHWTRDQIEPAAPPSHHVPNIWNIIAYGKDINNAKIITFLKGWARGCSNCKIRFMTIPLTQIKGFFLFVLFQVCVLSVPTDYTYSNSKVWAALIDLVDKSKKVILTSLSTERRYLAHS